MLSSRSEIRCASIPEAELARLADLRREPGISVTLDCGRAWVVWDDWTDLDGTRPILVERLLAIAGVEVFVRRGSRWHRPGESLPAFDLPAEVGRSGDRLDRLVFPDRLDIVPPPAERPRPVALRLVRDDRGVVRPASALRCRPRDLLPWAERAPSACVESVRGAWHAPAGGEPEVLLVGPSHRLPVVEDGVRFWGRSVLIPLGVRTEPELGERALREVAGAGEDDLVVFDDRGPELIPVDALRTLRRAMIRLAAAGRGSAAAGRGGSP